jgi:hypothetical protein
MEATEVPVLPLGSLAVIPVLAYSLLYQTPSTNSTVRGYSSPAQIHVLSFSTAGLFLSVFGFLAFSQHLTWADPAVGILLFNGMIRCSAFVLKVNLRLFDRLESQECKIRNNRCREYEWTITTHLFKNNTRQS